MFKCSLLATTALIVAGTLSFAAAHSAPPARPLHAGPTRDRNDQFLCTYGQFPVSWQWGGSSASLYSRWEHMAVPITGRGQTVSRILVKEGHPSGTYSANFSAGIYSDTASGLPGRLIAGGTARSNKNCRAVGVPISPTKLERRKRYWIEEQVPLPHWGDVNQAYWATNPKKKHKAYQQTHWFATNSSTGSTTSSTSPWTEMSAGPYAAVR